MFDVSWRTQTPGRFARALAFSFVAASAMAVPSSVVASSALVAADPISVDYSQRTDARGRVTFNLEAHEQIEGGELVISGSDGSRLKRSFNLNAGKSLRLTWTQKQGAVTYRMQLDSESVNANWEFEVLRPSAGHGRLEITSSHEDLVVYHRVSFRSSIDLTEYRLKVFDIEGQEIVDELTEDAQVSGGQTVPLSWDDDRDVFMVAIHGRGRAGEAPEYWAVPWSVEIPHTDVTFDSGKWDIRAAQRGKLDEAFAVLVHELDRLETATAAVNKSITARLYISGYTDTVGSASDNVTLSRNRARAIAQYFLDAGAWCEIYYAGMGERGLAVQTPDSTDLEANRRALYILDVDPPQASYLPAAGAWKRLSPGGPRRLKTTPELPATYYEHQERVQAERIRKRGGPAGSASSEATHDEAGSHAPEERGRVDVKRQSVDASFDGLIGEEAENDGAPPAVEGEPGATNQGCTAKTNGSSPGAFMLFAALIGLSGLRRRRNLD